MSRSERNYIKSRATLCFILLRGSRAYVDCLPNNYNISLSDRSNLNGTRTRP
jgi:hypothetical protein